MKHLTAGLMALVVLTGCGPVASEPPGTDVSGTYTGHSVRASAPNADAVQDTTTPDTTTYTLRIQDNGGFVHGVWTIEGDTAQPSDPWEAVITGDYTDGRMVLEYHSPTEGAMPSRWRHGGRLVRAGAPVRRGLECGGHVATDQARLDRGVPAGVPGVDGPARLCGGEPGRL